MTTAPTPFIRPGIHLIKITSVTRSGWRSDDTIDVDATVVQSDANGTGSLPHLPGESIRLKFDYTQTQTKPEQFFKACEVHPALAFDVAYNDVQVWAVCREKTTKRGNPFYQTSWYRKQDKPPQTVVVDVTDAPTSKGAAVLPPSPSTLWWGAKT